MPTYTPTTPTVLLCQKLADYVRDAWNPSAPDGVDWDFFRRWSSDHDALAAERLDGRQVVFFPTRYAWDPIDRASNGYTHEVTALVVERYVDGAGDPPREWTAERVDFVHTRIVAGLRFLQTAPAPWNADLVSRPGAAEVLDVSKLTGSGRLFYATVELEFLERVV